jgi:hypothetical protein
MADPRLAHFYPDLAAALARLTDDRQQSAAVESAEVAVRMTGADVDSRDAKRISELIDVLNQRAWDLADTDRAEASQAFRRALAVTALQHAVDSRPAAAICDATNAIRDQQVIARVIESV